MHVFDLKNERWICLFEEYKFLMKEGLNIGGQNSLNKSPTKIGGDNRRGTMMETGLNKMTSSKKMNKSSSIKRKSPRKLSLQNLDSEQNKDAKPREIESPTFISMKNSFLIRE